jgi:hypothetical protein
MHDLRLYRIALVPAFLAFFVAAFALENRPPPVTTPLSPQAFDGDRAHGGDARRPPRNSLRELVAAFPEREPGSIAEEQLGERVARELDAQGFRVTRRTRQADSGPGRASLTTVSGVRPGISSRRVVVLAHRDAAASPATAELSATAALLEIARVSRVRDLRRTLELVSTSGGSSGAAGARAWARAAGPDVDAVLVLGDLASDAERRPLVVPWSLAGRPAPLRLQRTVESAVRRELGTSPGRARAGAQLVRRAVPLTTSEQGALLAEGVPAVSLSLSGERPPPAARVTAARMEQGGRAALRALIALDQAPEGALRRGSDGLETFNKVLPTWAVRLLVGALLLPALLVAVDGFFRVGRRRGMPGRWLKWALAGAVPFVLAWGWARLMDLASILPAPRAPAPAGTVALEGAGAVALGSTVLILLAGWFVARRVLLRVMGHRGAPAEGGGGAAGTGLLLVLLAAALWVATPYAAALLVPAAHLWVFAISPDTRLRGWLAVAAVAAGLLAPALVALYYATALDMGPVDLLWLGFLAAAGGTLALPGALALSLFAASLIAVVLVLADRRGRTPRRPAAPPPRISRHAGPGALGGTPSALRP